MPDIFTSSSQTKKPTHPQPTSPPAPLAPISYTNPAPTPSQPAEAKTKTIPADPMSKPSGSMKLFSTFITHPLGVTFAEQDPDENVVLFFRADFITNVPWIIITLILLLIPIIIGIFIPLAGFSLSFFTPNVSLVLSIFYYLLVFSYAVINFMYWFYNVGIVSQKHVIDIDYADITYKNISTTTMGEISDIDYTQHGFLQTFFDFGDVNIRTQGSNIAIEFHSVPQPGKIVDIILHLREGAADNG